MSEEKPGESLHIDADWKTEAAQEKERLLREEQKAAAGRATDGGAQADGVTFIELVNLVAMQVVVALGGMQGPNGERIPANPPAAKHLIDLMSVLDEKTKGNLSEEEKRTLDGVLHELRMQYVQLVGGPAQPEQNKT